MADPTPASAPSEDRYEGLHCCICGEESGNTDLCVPCAVRALNADRRRESNYAAD